MLIAHDTLSLNNHSPMGENAGRFMCRWVAYRGSPLFLEELVSSPVNSLISQSHCATRAMTATNGDGFGVAWYGARKEPGQFRDVLPAWSDQNLKSLSQQISSPLFLAHVRAATSGGTVRDNCHPFVYGHWSYMDNGQIRNFDRLCRPLETMLNDQLYAGRHGGTDSELMFLLAMQFGMAQDPLGALQEAISYVERLAVRMDIDPLVRCTAAFSDGEKLYGVRYATDDKAPTLFTGPMGSGYCLVSEPLDNDAGAWVEIPCGSAITISNDGVQAVHFGSQSVLPRPDGIGSPEPRMKHSA